MTAAIPPAGRAAGPAPLPMVLPGPAAADLTCVRLDFAEAPGSDGGAAGLEDLAAASLHPDERSEWEALRSLRRRREWLMGRLAAKDAVRRRLESLGGVVPAPDAIAVRPDAWGRPLATCEAVEKAGPPPALSIAHTHGVAAAVAGTTSDGLGLDLERIDRRRGDYERAAFTVEERRGLDAGPQTTRAERALRLFCAKEAVAKAIGRGLSGSPLNLHVGDCDAEVTRAGIEVAGSLLRALPALRGRRIVAFIGTTDRLIVALARCAPIPPAP